MGKDHSQMLRMLGQRGLQKGQRFLGQKWFTIAKDIQHNTQNFTLYPIIARRLLPENGKIFQQFRLARLARCKEFMVAQTRIKGHSSQIKRQFLARQLIMLWISHLHKISWRNTKGRPSFLLPKLA